jgi:hypothetical protein
MKINLYDSGRYVDFAKDNDWYIYLKQKDTKASGFKILKFQDYYFKQPNGDTIYYKTGCAVLEAQLEFKNKDRKMVINIKGITVDKRYFLDKLIFKEGIYILDLTDRSVEVDYPITLDMERYIKLTGSDLIKQSP